ncbi:hypothetical protein PG990_008331 [Apiospora arundinis]|uniref:Uncharacterized protein n=1 Tax=Apiospora arundinis TaxID=335852 RepID=A0ABR2JMB1_9PEZI
MSESNDTADVRRFPDLERRFPELERLYEECSRSARRRREESESSTASRGQDNHRRFYQRWRVTEGWTPRPVHIGDQDE